jgi:diacylglycerol kinase (ATP)
MELLCLFISFLTCFFVCFFVLVHMLVLGVAFTISKLFWLFFGLPCSLALLLFVCSTQRLHRMTQAQPQPQPQHLSTAVTALKSKGVFTRLYFAAQYSAQGIRAGWQHEAALRSEMVALVVMTVVAFVTPLSTPQRVVLLGSMLLVLVVELLNSAIEAVVDLVCPNLHPLAGRAKDMGSAAVFICVLSSIGLWLWLAGPVWLRALGVV